MTTIRLNNGIETEVDAVTCSEDLGAFFIYTDKLSMADACRIFDDPKATETLRLVTDGATDGVYSGFNQLFSIRRADFFKSENMLQIWLQIPGIKPSGIDLSLGKMIEMYSKNTKHNQSASYSKEEQK